jgi:hypothetical protein
LSSEPSRPSVYTPFLRRFTDESARDLSETIALYNDIKRALLASVWSKSDIIDRINSQCADITGTQASLPSYPPLLRALDHCQTALIAKESVIVTFPEIDWSRAHLSMKERLDLQRFLRAKQYFLANDQRVFEQLATALCNVFVGVIEALPSFPEDAEDSSLTVPLIMLLRDPGGIVDRIIGTICKDDLADVGLFTELQKQLYTNVCRASGVDPEDEKPRRPLVTADESDLEPVELVETYLKGTPFVDLLLTPAPFEIPITSRFQHQWIVAPPGTGKSTAMQYLIARDLELVANDEASIVVMESNRDLIKAIEGLKVFAPGQALDGKLLLIDAEDVEWPIALNLFDIGSGDFSSYSPADREALNNSVLSLYEYIFSALLSAEMTSRQNTLFNFTIQLLLQIPGATIDTLIDLMQPGGLKQFAHYLPTLDHDARRFFDLKFNSKEFDRTKDQVVDRLFAVKRIRTLSRMFSAPRSKLDFFKEMGAAKVILINVPKSLLQEDGVEIVGRFFISMILLAAHKRQLLPKQQRLPCFVYIDECQDFIRADPKIPVILDQARKLNVGLVLAHQRLQQLQNYVLDALYGATAIKFAAQVSDSAAHALARDMRTTPEFILNQQPYHFAAYVRGLTSTAISLGIPNVDMNRMPRMSATEQEAVRQSIRALYAQPRLPFAQMAQPLAAPPSPPKSITPEESDETGRW